MLPRLRTTATCAAAAAVLLTTVATDAAAVATSLTPGASAYSAAADTGTGSLQANLQLTGSLGGLLDWAIDPIMNQALNPLVAALQGTVNSVVASALGASSNLNAATDPSEPQVAPAPAAFPNDTLPTPCASSGAQPCYSAASASANGAPLASLALGTLSGYAEQVDATADAANPIFGRASALSPQVSVLPGITSLVPLLPTAVNPLVSAGVVQSMASCPNDGAVGATKPTTPPSADISTTGVTLLGGLVTFGALDDQLTNLTVNGTSYPDLLHMPTVSVAGVTISSYGGSVLVSVPLTADQLFAGLGLPASVVTTLAGLTPTSTVNLSLVVGPNSALTNQTASAWGLGIGVNLSGSLSFNLFNVVTATVTIPTGIGGGNYGNLLDVRLAYSTCHSGIKPGTSGPPPIPPALV